MARGLSREQSVAKNAKKAEGANKGNQETLTPSQRKERCARPTPPPAQSWPESKSFYSV